MPVLPRCKRSGDQHFQLDYAENLLYDYQSDQHCRRMPFIRVDVVSAGHLDYFSIPIRPDGDMPSRLWQTTAFEGQVRES